MPSWFPLHLLFPPLATLILQTCQWMDSCLHSSWSSNVRGLPHQKSKIPIPSSPFPLPPLFLFVHRNDYYLKSCCSFRYWPIYCLSPLKTVSSVESRDVLSLDILPSAHQYLTTTKKVLNKYYEWYYGKGFTKFLSFKHSWLVGVKRILLMTLKGFYGG